MAPKDKPMTRGEQLAHDGAESLTVTNRGKYHHNLVGWYVVRTCACHSGQKITVPFRTQAQAEAAMRALDDDAIRTATR